MTGTSVTADYQAVQKRIRMAAQQVGRNPDFIRLLAVSKAHPAAAVARLYALGQRAFGENYLQDALTKIVELSGFEIEWHYIGHIQSNKTRDIARHFHWVHSVDRFKIASRLSEQRPVDLEPLNICIQVNLDQESAKSGIDGEQLLVLAQQLRPLSGVRLRGMMVLPKPGETFAQQVASLRRAQVLFSALGQKIPGIDTLSMGMSGDLEAAVAAGSTMVRVGTAIFGPRPQVTKPGVENESNR